jgi:autotransporter translocation and assembly factor TamB
MAARAPAYSRWARALLRALLAFLGLLVVTGVALFLVGRANWGRQRILAIVLPAIQGQLLGKLRIGALDGDFTHMLVLRDVELYDAEAQLVARVPYVGLRYDLLALLGRTLHVTAVDVRGAELHARTLADGRLNLAALVRSDDSPPSTGPLPLRILVSGIDVDLAARYDGPPGQGPLSQVAAKLRLRGDLHLRPDRQLSVELKALSVDASAPLVAKLGLSGRLALSLLEVKTSLAVHGVKLSLQLSGEEVTRLVPAAKLHGPLSLVADLDGTLATLSAQLALKLPVGQAQLETKLGLLDDKLPWQLAVSLQGFDPSALREGLLPAEIALALRGSGNGPAGQVELQDLSVRTRKNALKLQGKAEALATPPIWEDPFAGQVEMSLQVDAGDLAELVSLGVPPIGGALTLNLQATLKQRSLGVTAKLDGTNLRAPGITAERLQLDLRAQDLGGKLKLSVNNLAAAGQRLARLALEAEGDQRLLRLQLDGEGPQALGMQLSAAIKPELAGGAGVLGLQGITLKSLTTTLNELQLHRGEALLSLTQPAELRLLSLQGAPIAELSSLALTLGALKLRLDGRFETEGQKLRAALDVRDLDVQEVVRIATGRADVPRSALALHLDAAGTVAKPTAEVRLSGFIEPLAGLLPWRVAPELSASLAGRRVRGELGLRAEPTKEDEHPPSLNAHFEAPLSLDGAISLKLDAATGLAALRPFLPPAVQELSGEVAMQFNLGGTLKQPQATLAVTLPRWGLPPVRGQETALTVAYQDQKLNLELNSRVLSWDEHQLLRGHIAARLPLRLGIEVGGDQILEQLSGCAGTVEVALQELALPRLLAVATGSPEKWPLSAGTAELLVQAQGPLGSPTLNARFFASALRVALGGGLPDATAETGLELGYQKDALKLQLHVNLDGKPTLVAQAGTTVRMAELLHNGASLLQKLPLAAKVELLPTPLPAALGVSGLLSAQAEAHGTPQTLELSLNAAAQALRVGDWPVGELALQATLDAQKRLQARATLAQKAGDEKATGGKPGTLSLLADVPLPFSLTAPELQVALAARSFRIDYQAVKGQSAAVRLVRATLDSNLTVRGGTPQPVISGELDLKDGQLSTAALPQLVRDIVVELRARPDGVLSLLRASARADQGRVEATGQVELTGGTLRSVELNSTINNFPIAAGSLGLWLDTKLQVAGKASDDTLRVKVNIPYGTLRLPRLSTGSDSDVQPLGPLEDVHFVDAAARRVAEQAEAAATAQRADAQKAPRKTTPLLPPRTLVTVELPKAFAVSGPEVKTNVTGHLDAELGGRAANSPVLTGEIRTLGGAVEILGRRYQIENGQVSLSGEVPPNPLLDVSISRKFDDVTIFIEVTGTARKPSIKFRSDPATYDQSQIIGMVLSGTHGGGSMQSQALGALSGLIVGQLKGKLGGALPVDVIKLDVGGNDSSGANQSSLEVGKYLRDNLYLSYTQLFNVQNTILHHLNNEQVSLEWDFLPSYQINLMGGDQGVGALNVYWRKRF